MVNNNGKIHLVECPRDAMQGWKHIISTNDKVTYLQKLLQVGFDTLDCGSFVSPKAIPQMADTAAVLEQLSNSGWGLTERQTKLLVIVANERGAQDAVKFDAVSYLGFPFSVSPAFQYRNTNSSIEESWHRVEEIQELCLKTGKQLVIYISMGFGNPYGDPYSQEVVMEWVDKMVGIEVKTISLADTVGLATPGQVADITGALVPAYPDVNIGVHLHSTQLNWQAKTDAALNAGCLRFDGALKGIGGCPMANDTLVGNMDTELMIPYFESKGLLKQLNHVALEEALGLAARIFV